MKIAIDGVAMAAQIVFPCPTCGDRPSVEPDPCGFGYHASCRNCFDADCDQDGLFATSPTGHGPSEADALDAWNDVTCDDAPPEGTSTWNNQWHSEGV